MAYADKTLEQQENLQTLYNGMIGMYGDKFFDDDFNMQFYRQVIVSRFACGWLAGGDWLFLFSEYWPRDIQEAIARLGMYINGFDPAVESWDYDSRYAGGES